MKKKKLNRVLAVLLMMVMSRNPVKKKTGAI